MLRWGAWRSTDDETGALMGCGVVAEQEIFVLTPLGGEGLTAELIRLHSQTTAVTCACM